MRLLNTAKTNKPENLKSWEFVLECKDCGARHAASRSDPDVIRDNENNATTECIGCGRTLEFIVPPTKRG